MRLRNIPGAAQAVEESRFVIHRPQAHRGRFRTLFGNDHPIYIEIGMGKGKFIIQSAMANPQINYIGIELYSSVLYRGLQKMEALAEEGKAPENLKFLCLDARVLAEVFGEHEIDRIYLNFSDPWPKDRHAKRRLPSRQFLRIYDRILAPEGTIEFKTDNRGLFDFAVEELPHAGWEALAVTYDLHHDEALVRGNVMTEYEERFSGQGNPICKYIIRRSRRS